MDTDDLDIVPDFPASSGSTDDLLSLLVRAPGMGRQTAHALAQAGAKSVLCVDVNDELAGRCLPKSASVSLGSVTSRPGRKFSV